MIMDGKRCVFVHIPKTGGTTVNTILKEQMDFQWKPIEKHFQLRDYYVWYPRTKNYRSFTLVRNPWDNFVSLFSFMQTFPNEIVPTSFEGFLYDLDVGKLRKHLRDLKWDQALANLYERGQDNWLDKRLDFILKLEDLKKDASLIERELKVKIGEVPVTNFSKRNKNYRDYYKNQKMINIVADKNKRLLSLVNYEF